MTKVFALKNFILLNYKRDIDDEPLPKNSFTKEEYSQYLLSQEEIFEFAKHQIQTLYPKCHIHVLSNKKHRDNNSITHHFMEFMPNHQAKFNLFGLLNEPAMYLDTDILLNYKFTTNQLSVSGPFNCYRCRADGTNLQEMSPIPLPCQVDCIFNAGLIWIPSPSQEIVQELNEINNIYFSNKEWLLAHNKWLNNDEWALSVYINKNKMKMKILPEVNLARGTGAIPRCQSLHYTGVTGKALMLKEVSYFQYRKGLPL